MKAASVFESPHSDPAVVDPIAEDISAYGVPYDDWNESWSWRHTGRIERFDRLHPAIEFARLQDARCPDLADATLYDDPFVTPRRLCDSAFKDHFRQERSIHVFSEERKTANNSRFIWTFFATDYGTLWRRLSDLKFNQVHCYEMIEEDQPCHLYFDLEFQKTCNPGLDGNKMVEALVKELERVMKRRWGISLTDAFVMEMDASTEEKFSRHLIVRLQGHAFRNNAQIKPVVKEIIYNAPPGMFDVQKSSGSCLFIDEAVYSRNRSFRMLWSCKSGKQNPLKPSKRFSLNGYAYKGISNTQRLFYLSIISNVVSGVELLESADEFGHLGATPCSILQTASKSVRSKGRSVELIQRSQTDCGPCHFEERAVSFIPLLEQLIYHLSNQPATVKKIVFLGYDGLVSYNVDGPGSHFCLLIGRAHRRNYAYYLVDLQRFTYQQRCFDPECDKQKAKWTPIPVSLLKSFDLAHSVM